MIEEGTGHGEKFTQKQEAAILALLTCRTHEQAAEAAGIGPATLSRWLRLPEFRTRLQDARQEAFVESVGKLKGAAGAAVDALRELLTCDNPGVKLRAAIGILEQAHKGAELLELEERLARLEQQQNTPGGITRYG